MKKMLMALLSGLLLIGNTNMIYAEETSSIPEDESGWATAGLYPEGEELTPAETSISQDELLDYEPVDDTEYDVNGDGVTDIQDVESILEYAILVQQGTEYEIDEAEFSKWDVFPDDETVTSYDAYCLIVWIQENQPEADAGMDEADTSVKDGKTGDVVTVPLYDDVTGWDDEDMITTNGIYMVEYDADLTAYEDISLTVDSYFVIDDNENGQLWIAFADAVGFDAGEPIGEMVFTKPSEVTTLTINIYESNDLAPMGESREVEIGGESEPSVIESVSLVLKEKIEARFYIYIPDDEVNTTDIILEFNGETTTYHAGDILPKTYNSKPCRIVSVATFAKQMRDIITVTLIDTETEELKPLEYKEEDVTKGMEFKIEDYVKLVEANSTNAKLIDLVHKMDNYGKYAQIQFKNYNRESFDEADPIPSDYDDSRLAQYNAENTDEGITGLEFAAVSLELESDSGVRVYYNLTGTDDISTYTFTIDGEEAAPVKKGSQYYVVLKGIPARMMHKPHTIVVTDKDGKTLSTEYCALTYPSRVVAADAAPESLKNLARSIDLYAEAALAYFGDE